MRRAWVRVAVGLLLLTLGVGAAFVAHGVSAAADTFRHSQAEWQRGLAAAPGADPGRAQRTGEVLLGIDARADVLRVYQRYQAGLANVIPGTLYPQTRARYEAVAELRRLRSSFDDSRGRSSVDVVLGAIFTGGAATAGKQRTVQTRYAIDAFTRAVLEDPENATAKLDLEVLLRSQLDRERGRAQPHQSNSPSRRRQRQQDPRGPTLPARAEGTGY